MWKKALWVYLCLYAIGLVYLIISTAIRDSGAGTFDLATLLLSLVFLLPAILVAFDLRGKKVPILLLLLGLLIIAFPIVGIFNFNEMNLETIGKALLFVPMIVGLVYPGYKRVSGTMKRI
jgi:hypothetical protein